MQIARSTGKRSSPQDHTQHLELVMTGNVSNPSLPPACATPNTPACSSRVRWLRVLGVDALRPGLVVQDASGAARDPRSVSRKRATDRSTRCSSCRSEFEREMTKVDGNDSVSGRKAAGSRGTWCSTYVKSLYPLALFVQNTYMLHIGRATRSKACANPMFQLQ